MRRFRRGSGGIFACTDLYEQRSQLDEDHHFGGLPVTEVVERGDVVKDESEINCQLCYESASESDWRVEDGETKDGGGEFFVNCGGCNREIEFGWSHPDRGGRIWPVESSDFNPWKSWPEPRYKESWRAKGWLRPNSDAVA